jgi:hypothetical protein
VHLDLVEARHRGRKTHEPVDANNSSPPRRQRERVEQAARTHVLCLYELAGVASPDVLRDVAGLPRPEGEPSHQGRRLVPTEVASERGVVALLENAMAQVTTIGDAEPVCFALAASIEQTTWDQEGASRWSSIWDLCSTLRGIMWSKTEQRGRKNDNSGIRPKNVFHALYME